MRCIILIVKCMQVDFVLLGFNCSFLGCFFFGSTAEFGDYGQQRQEKFTINDLQEYVLLPRVS